MAFFTELGFLFPQFPFIAHSRGWSAEDMENNIVDVENSSDLKEGAKDLARRSIEMARIVIASDLVKQKIVLSGRKARKIEMKDN